MVAVYETLGAPSGRKILLYGLNFHPEPTGAGKYTGEMAAWLAEQGWEVRVVTASPYYPDWKIAEGYNGKVYARENIGGVRVYRAPLWVPKKPSGRSRLVHLASFALSSAPLLLQALWWRPQVVCCVAPAIACAPAAVAVSWLSGAKSWLHVQDLEVDAAFELGMLGNPLLRRCAGFFERTIMAAFDRVSTISEKMLERVVEKGATRSRAVLFQNWVDTESIRPMPRATDYRRELGIPEHACVALYSGTMANKQGLDIVADAARLLSANENIHFILCGQGPGLPALHLACEGLARVHFLPLQPLERFNELLATANLHLLPQQKAAADLVLPSKLSGMLASGRPVVATAEAGTGLAAWVQDCGAVVPPGDAAAFARAIEELSNDVALAERLGAVARARAEQRLSRNSVLGAFAREALALEA